MADAPVSATVPRPPGPVSTCAGELAALAGRLDPDTGWYAVFAAHDPEGLRDCLSGREVPPWDVVASLLADLGRLHGSVAARHAEERLRPLHGAAVAAYDVAAGGVPVLRGRLAALAEDLEAARALVRELEAQGASTDAHWARDHVVRVEARCVELRGRMAALESAPGPVPGPAPRPAPGPVPVPPSGSGAPPDQGPDPVPDPGPPAAPPTRTRRARRGGSRFAGGPVAQDGTEEPGPIVPPGAPSSGPVPGDGPYAGAGVTGALPLPRGARFAGTVPAPSAGRAAPTPEEIAGARAAAADAVQRLRRLRRTGSGGEAHALLCEAAHWRPLRFAVLVEELQRCGLAADAGLLLWEAAALPAGSFAAAAGALSALGRDEDAERMLRQGVSRPPQELAETALALHRAGRTREATWLLAAVISARTPAGAAQVARAEPPVLVGLLLEAARALSWEQCLSVARAMRTAELPGVPEAL